MQEILMADKNMILSPLVGATVDNLLNLFPLDLIKWIVFAIATGIRMSIILKVANHLESISRV
jgi:hypothetical protein